MDYDEVVCQRAEESMDRDGRINLCNLPDSAGVIAPIFDAFTIPLLLFLVSVRCCWHDISFLLYAVVFLAALPFILS